MTKQTVTLIPNGEVRYALFKERSNGEYFVAGAASDAVFNAWRNGSAATSDFIREVSSDELGIFKDSVEIEIPDAEPKPLQLTCILSVADRLVVRPTSAVSGISVDIGNENVVLNREAAKTLADYLIDNLPGEDPDFHIDDFNLVLSCAHYPNDEMIVESSCDYGGDGNQVAFVQADSGAFLTRDQVLQLRNLFNQILSATK